MLFPFLKYSKKFIGDVISVVKCIDTLNICKKFVVKKLINDKMTALMKQFDT